MENINGISSVDSDIASDGIMSPVETAIRTALTEALWTGQWYDTGIAVHCDYHGKIGLRRGEVARPLPGGITAYIAACNPIAMASFLAEFTQMRSELKRLRSLS